MNLKPPVNAGVRPHTYFQTGPMSKPLNLTSSQAAAVRSTLMALRFEHGEIHIDFHPVDAVTNAGWITERDGLHEYGEHKE